jgi:3',5'-cyclic AMP phosphodiesterase CpdA
MSDLTIAHVTDTHHGGPRHAARRNRQALEHLLALDPLPDLLLVTGDVADHGTPEEYAASRETWTRWPGRLLVLPGNHDVRAAFSAAWLDGRDGPLDQELVVDGVRVLALDSLVTAPPGRRIDHGELAASSLEWLEHRLSSVELPTLVCLHHPPVRLGVELMDPIMLRDPDRLAAVLERHPSVVAVLVGHAHTACATTFAGRPLLVGGGIASTVPLDAEPLPTIWEDGPVTFALHRLLDGRLVTHWRSL